jgi:class 3 adenylate cyclase
MCASTYEALQDRPPEAERLELQLKGKEEPVRAYRIRQGQSSPSSTPDLGPT